MRCNTGEDLLTRELPRVKEWKRGSDGNGSAVPFRMVRLSNDIRQGTYCVAQHECQGTAVCPVTTLKSGARSRSISKSDGLLE